MEGGVVRFGLDYVCAHIIIPASVNLLPIQADFVTERGITVLPSPSFWREGWTLPNYVTRRGKKSGNRQTYKTSIY